MQDLSKLKFMQLAIDSAREGINRNEGGPFGACIVKNDQVLAIAHNTVLKDIDPTCHAEMNAIRLAAKSIGNHDLTGCEIYTTAEPCPMCLTAIYWAKISRIYIGVDKYVAARFGFSDEAFYQELMKPLDARQVPCHFEVLTAESEAIFQEWHSLAGKLY